MLPIEAAHLEELGEFAEQMGTDGDTLFLLLLLFLLFLIFFLDVLRLMVKVIFFVLLVIFLNRIYQVKEQSLIFCCLCHP